MRVTGGAIETSDTKTDWVNIDFEWKNEKWNMKPKDDQMMIHVRNHTGNEVVIKQLEPSTARETLGVMQSITGDEQPQVEKLLKKIKQWETNVMPSGLTPHETRIAMTSTIGRTLEYPLPATAMNTDQCQQLNKAFKKCALPKSGIVRSAAEELVYTPDHLLGLGLKDIETQQKIAHLKILLEHGAEDNKDIM